MAENKKGCTLSSDAGHFGYFHLENNKIVPIGFAGIRNHYLVTQTFMGATAMIPNDNAPRYLRFKLDERTLSSRCFINYLEEIHCIDCLFVYVNGMWVQCPDTLVREI